MDTAQTNFESPLRRYSNVEYGWECPRCGCINAPWVRQCNCSRDKWTITIPADKITINAKQETV